MSNSDIKIGQSVIAPITDKDGEVQYVTGILVSMNSRYAKVDLGNNEIINVGKSKIEALEHKKQTKKAPKKVIVCSACDTKAEDGDTECGECGEALEDTGVGRIAERYEYSKVASASGRTSCDNNDRVAQDLRGKDLKAAYQIVAKAIGKTQQDLKTKYSHLNPGHQRMCLGNLLRGFYKRQDA